MGSYKQTKKQTNKQRDMSIRFEETCRCPPPFFQNNFLSPNF